MKIRAHSFERYRGGAAERRKYGGQGTITRFFVYRAEDERDPSKWLRVEGHGPTPGDRKTDAIARSGLLAPRVGRVVAPDAQGRCGTCGFANFTLRERARYRCNGCGDIKVVEPHNPFAAG